MKHRRNDWVVVIASIVLALSGCGGGCGGCGMTPIPGGFPVAKRTANAAQIRVTPTALAAISADPAAVIGPLVGNAMNGIIDFSIPGSCGGNPEICCVNNVPSAACGPLEIDLVKRPTDQPRLVLTPVAGANRLDMTIRARVKTVMKLPISYDTGIIGTISCDVAIDTTKGNSTDLQIDAQIQFSQDATVGTTRIAANNVAVTQLEGADITLSGNIGCSIAGAFVGAFTGTLQDQIASLLTSTINDATCKACASGTVAECGSSFATACTNNVVHGREPVPPGARPRRPHAAASGAVRQPVARHDRRARPLRGRGRLRDARTTAASRSACSAACSRAASPRDRCGPPATEPGAGHDPAVDVLPGQRAPRDLDARSTSASASTSRSSASSRGPATTAACCA